MVVLIPAIDFFYQFAQPRPGNLDSQILATIAVPVMLIALAAQLLKFSLGRLYRLSQVIGCRLDLQSVFLGVLQVD